MCDCFKGFAKVILCIINVIFLLAGLLMFCFGIALTASPQKVLSFFTAQGVSFNDFSIVSSDYITQVIQACGIFMIVLGIIVALVAIFGFFGACCDNKCMLITYAVILIIIVLAEVALIIFGAVYPQVFDKAIDRVAYPALIAGFKKDIQADAAGNYGSNGAGLSDAEAAWSLIQYKFKCCGVYNASDYGNGNFIWQAAMCGSSQCKAGINVVPSSCCVLKNPSQPPASINDYVSFSSCVSTANSTVTNTVGCESAISQQARSIILQYSKIAIGIAAGIVGLEIILIILAIIMACEEGGSNKYV